MQKTIYIPLHIKRKYKRADVMLEHERRQWNLFRLNEADIVDTAPQIFNTIHCDLTYQMRAGVLHWLVEVCSKFKIRYEVYFGTVTLFDRFLASLLLCVTDNINDHDDDDNNDKNNRQHKQEKRNDVTKLDRDNIKCVGCACFYIMCLLHEQYPCELEDLVYATNHVYSNQDIAEMAHRIVFVLDGDVQLSPTPYDFLKCLTASYAIVRPVSMKKTDSKIAVDSTADERPSNDCETKTLAREKEAHVETLARFFLERACLQWKGVISQYRLSVCACAALYLAHCIVIVDQKQYLSRFLQQLSKNTCVSEQQITRCADALYNDKYKEITENINTREKSYFAANKLLSIYGNSLGSLEILKLDDCLSCQQDLLAQSSPHSSVKLDVGLRHRVVEKCAVTKVYEKGDKLGTGTYGVVRRAINKTITGLEVAVKIFTVVIDEEDADEVDFVSKTTLREISLMRKMDHPNIAKVLSIFFPTPFQCCITMPLMEGGSLRNYYIKHPSARKDRTKRRNLLRQVCSALTYMHNRGISHRDVKPDNIVVDERGERAMLIDFGLARSGSIIYSKECFSGHVCTIWYRPPELLLGCKTYNASAVDIWSLACVFVEMARERAIFPGQCQVDQIFRIFRFHGTPNENSWPGVTKLPNFQKTFPKWSVQQSAHDSLRTVLGSDGYDLFCKWTRYVPEKRLSAHESLRSHPYFQNKFVACEISNVN